ncbi:MAG TPA: hypothetical protein VGN18_16180 [Jatrophihabitans sp.]|uniref:hypothetical protein n=1 Tax=Jatrophihabitans sp. TaxID=1932789 RepID=UPI002E09D5D2|nr:hypothetical protein [Jatrophihabitans sp.]
MDLPITAAQLLMTLDGPDTRNTLTFTCPTCGAGTSQRITERGTRLLSAAGVVLLAPGSSTVQTERGS